MAEAPLKTRSPEQDRVRSPLHTDVKNEELMPPAQRKEQYRDIGQELRRMFDDVLSEPIPDEILALMKKLEDQTRGGGGSGPKS